MDYVQSSPFSLRFTTNSPHLDLITRPSPQVHAPARQGKGGKRRSRREHTSDDESMDEAEIQEYFDIPHFKSPENITPTNSPNML